MKIRIFDINDGYLPLFVFPRAMATRAVGVYFACLLLVSAMYFSQAMPLWLMVFSVVAVPMFFMGSAKYTKEWANLRPKTFEKRLFGLAVLIRLAFTALIVWYNWEHYDTYTESNAPDTQFYIPEAAAMVEAWGRGELYIDKLLTYDVELGDVGYATYLAVLSFLTGSIAPITLPLILKAFLGAATCVFIYRVAARHFGESIGRMAGIFCMLQFSMIWWCSSMMKETEMLFLECLFVECADDWLMNGRPKPSRIVLIGATLFGLFTVRTALAVICLLAIGMAVILADSQVVSTGRKILTGVLMVIVLLAGSGGKIYQSIQDTLDIEGVQGRKEAMMQHRATRTENGNTFAKYASSTVFAPFIFTIPFPTMVYTTQDQEMQAMVNGGNFEKNLLSIFVIISMVILLVSGEWRKHIFPLSVLLGYLVALVISDFAQSGRFHMPAVPLEMMFAAYGLSLCGTNPKYKRWYKYALAACFVFCLAWNYIKLKGKGLA